ESATTHFAAATHDDPADLRGWYLLAWAQSKDDGVAARETLSEAERRGPPQSADAWFYRGLAIHFDDAAEAINSYRQANAVRAREGMFYPQAILHLARARNQQMYASRTIDPFMESEAGLHQLIEQQHYGAYPYYLLSIAHRLAAEIYSGSAGTRDDSLVEYHYAQALEWARRGQQLDPTNDRPIAAEAECLESMGRLDEALEARTRAIESARRRWGRCESLHYRWRLNYWTGHLDAALADIEEHAACDPESVLYSHVYPALVMADMGDPEAARTRALDLARAMPTDALAIIWSAATLRLLGDAAQADELLAEYADKVDFTRGWEPQQSETWLRVLYAHCQSGDRLDELQTLADQTDAPWKLWGEAFFHTALWDLSAGNRAACVAELRRAHRSFDGEINYTYHARLLLVKMQQNSSWPTWNGVSWDDEVPGS
ncbi:MAG: tetratricopeptide repeat protein, partial [Phycisphaerae bacterium]|nr:tetratricopeptide repeat protein [Phycisphaerae bacterium]